MLIAIEVVTTVMMFIPRPAFIICAVVRVEAPKTIALGAVATGSMKAYEEVNATDMIK